MNAFPQYSEHCNIGEVVFFVEKLELICAPINSSNNILDMQWQTLAVLLVYGKLI